MSLMNDALRKKRSEKKHPAGADFLKPDEQPASQNKIRIIALAALGVLVCAVGGYFGYEYYRLSRPTTPRQPAPLVAAAPPPAHPGEKTAMQTEADSEPTPPPREPIAAADPTQQASEAGTAGGEAKPQTPPQPGTEPPRKASAGPEDAGAQPPAAPKTHADKAARPADTAPDPVIEPDGPPDPPPAAAAATETTSAKASARPQHASDSIVERLYRKGLSYHRQNDLNRAIQMYLAARKKNPDNTAVCFNLASAYIQVGAFTEAQTILTDLHLKEPDNPGVLLNMAVAEIGLNRPEKALAFLDRAAAKFARPRYEVLFHRGTAYSRMGNFADALSFYQQAENMAPATSRLPLNIAIAHDNLSHYDQALAYYLKFLDRNATLDPVERKEIEMRVRQLRAYLAQTPKTFSEQETGVADE